MTPDRRTDELQKLESVLADGQLSDRVEMVLRPYGDHCYKATSAFGSVVFERRVRRGTHEYEVQSTIGRNPLAEQSTTRLVGLEVEGDHVFPSAAENSYPFAFDSIAQFFDSPVAPDLVVMHTAAHDTDGNLGQHGSLAVTQARAPFIAAGAGIRALGAVACSARMVDVAPTIATLLGVDPHPSGRGPTGSRRSDALLRRQDGDPIHDVLSGEGADHVVVILLDGCNANLLHDAIGTGEAPNLDSLVEQGTSYVNGLFASLPTATLANHTTAVTGAHPGHSGILNHTWFDRSDGSVPELLSMEEMFWATKYLEGGVETIFEALERTRPGAFTSATFEFCDRGATMSSFGLVRGGSTAGLPDLGDVDHVDGAATAVSANYGFMSTVDHLSMVHTIEGWEKRHGNELPTLSWCSLSLTDEAAHESGPHGELARAAIRDSDVRVGEILEAIERAGALARTAVLVISDHGMEQTDPNVSDRWDATLRATGVAHRDIGGGLIYLTPARTHP